MGTASSVASVATEKDVKADTFDYFDYSSDEVRSCEICEKDLKAFFCKFCKKNLCKKCCEHVAKRQNPFYYCSQIPVRTDTFQQNFSDGSEQNVKCGTIDQRGNVVLLSQTCYKNDTFEWKLCYLHGRQLCIAKRQPTENKAFAFPGDICFIESKSKLFLTIPCKKMIYELERGGNFRDAFSTPLGACFRITPFGNGLALSVQTSAVVLASRWQIQFVDFKGNVLRRIQNTPEGKAYFEEPLHLTSNKTKNVLFVSDREQNAVFAFDEIGTLMYQFHGLPSPLGIAADKFDNVYVACGKEVIQIERSGEKSRDLSLDTKDNVVCLCMDYCSDTLTVISTSGHIASFNFE